MKPTTLNSFRHGVVTREKKICRDIYGDKMEKKKRENIRIVNQNINGLGTSVETDKRDAIKNFIVKNKIDLFVMSEVNINWKVVAKRNSMGMLAKKWFENSRAITANNTLYNTKNHHQQGGVAIITAGEMALRVKHQNKDGRNLGRWCSTLI